MKPTDKNRAAAYPFADGSHFTGIDRKEIFSSIAKTNFWTDPESVSGIGSSSLQTRFLVQQLPMVFRRFGIRSILDIPCGDFNWMKDVDLEGMTYVGGDLVRDLIDLNRATFSRPNISFSCFDLLTDNLGKFDLLFCRDCLVHFSFHDIDAALENIKRSGSRYLMMTTFTGQARNEDIPTGGWRPLNFGIHPFKLRPPVFMLNENCSEMDGLFQDKSLGVWAIDEL